MGILGGIDDSVNDQGHLTKLYLERPHKCITIDFNCSIFHLYRTGYDSHVAHENVISWCWRKTLLKCLESMAFRSALLLLCVLLMCACFCGFLCKVPF